MKRLVYILFFTFFLSCSQLNNSTLIIGDSLLSGFQIEKDKAPITILKQKIYGNINSYCEIGLTASAFSKNLNYYTNKNYSHVIIMLGANDFLLECNSEKTLINFERMIDFFSKYNSKICFISFIDSSMFQNSKINKKLLYDYLNMFNKLKNYKNVIVADNIFKNQFFNKKYKSDLYHLNEKGSLFISKNILFSLKQNHFFY